MVLLSVPRRQVAEPLPVSFASSEPNFPRHPSWDSTVLSALNQFFREWTEPEMLIGMGLGHLGWEAGRLLGINSALSAGLAGRAALWAGRAGGVLTEGAIWASAAQAGRYLDGKPSHDFSSFGKTWADNSLFATIFRSAQGLLGPAGPWGMALGTYAGLVISQQALSVARTRQTLPWAETMGHSAALFANFYAGGAAARGLWGEALARMEQSFRWKYQQAQSGSGGFGDNSTFLNLEALGQRRPAIPEGAAPSQLWAIGGDPGSGDSLGGPRRPFSSRPRMKEGVEKEGSFELPWKVQDKNTLLGIMENSNLLFRDRFLKDHLFFVLVTAQGHFNSEILEALNKLTYISSLPGGRKIQIRFQSEPHVYEFIKLMGEFRLRERGRITPPDNPVPPRPSSSPPASTTPGQTAADLARVRESMDRVATRSPRVPRSMTPSPAQAPAFQVAKIQKAPQPVTMEGSARTISTSPVILKLVSDTKGLVEFLKALNKGPAEKTFGEVLINQTIPLGPEELHQAHNIIKQMGNDSRISLYDPPRCRTFGFYKEGLIIKASNTEWQEPKQFDHLEVHSLLELLQKLSFLRKLPISPKGPVFVDIRGQWRPWQDGPELEKFLNVQLQRHTPPLQLRQGVETQTFFYEASKGTWKHGNWE